jgi:hypothetical protein
LPPASLPGQRAARRSHARSAVRLPPACGPPPGCVVDPVLGGCAWRRTRCGRTCVTASWAAFTHGLPAVRMRVRSRVRQSARWRSAQAPSNSAAITTSIHMPGLTTCAGARPTSPLLPALVSLNVRPGPRAGAGAAADRLGGQPVRRGKPGSVRVRRAMIMASASDTPVSAGEPCRGCRTGVLGRRFRG